MGRVWVAPPSTVRVIWAVRSNQTRREMGGKRKGWKNLRVSRLGGAKDPSAGEEIGNVARRGCEWLYTGSSMMTQGLGLIAHVDLLMVTIACGSLVVVTWRFNETFVLFLSFSKVKCGRQLRVAYCIPDLYLRVCVRLLNSTRRHGARIPLDAPNTRHFIYFLFLSISIELAIAFRQYPTKRRRSASGSRANAPASPRHDGRHPGCQSLPTSISCVTTRFIFKTFRCNSCSIKKD
jgi:hypothetical protein